MELSEGEMQMYNKLHSLRSEIAVRHGIPPYNVLGAPVLRELAVQRPTDLGMLGKMEGMSEKKVQDYGTEVIEVIEEACREYELTSNVPKKALRSNDEGWITVKRIETKPVTENQLALYNNYVRSGTRTLAQVGASMLRPIVESTAVGYMVACLDAGRSIPWDHYRLGIDHAIESQVLGVVKSLQASGLDPLAKGFRLKPIFEDLPPGTDPSAYNMIRLILARLRSESRDQPLPMVGDGALTPSATSSQNVSVVGKKRSLPSWDNRSSSQRGFSGMHSQPPPSNAKRHSSSSAFGTGHTQRCSGVLTSRALEGPDVSKAHATHAPTRAHLFVPSYKRGSDAVGGAEASEGSGLCTIPTKKEDSIKDSTPMGAGEHMKKNKIGSQGVVPDARGGLTTESLNRAIQDAGGSGLTLQDMVRMWPGSQISRLKSMLKGMREDFLVYTKVTDTRSGRLEVYVCL
ncbi:unnamed protein product [Discosporangium mesarthrocarpum]